MRRKLPIFYSALLLTAVNLLLRLVSTSFQVHISTRIGAAGVGLLQLVLSVSSLAMTAGIAGVRTATMYLTAEELGKKHPEYVSNVLLKCCLYSLICSTTVSVILYTAAPMMARHWIGNIHVVGAIRLFSLFLPLICLSSCMTGYFTAANRIGTLVLVEVLEQLCYMAVTMAALLYWAGNDPEKACQAVVLGSGVSACVTLLCLFCVHMRSRVRPGKSLPIASRLLQTAVPLAIADDVKSGISTTENLMVPKRLALYPGEISPLAAFGMVCGMVFPVLMFPAAILFGLAELLIPELARCQAAGSRERIAYLAMRSLKVAMLYGFFCAGLLYLLSDSLCLWLYHSVDAAGHLRRFAFLAPMLYCDAISDAITKGLGQQKICVRYNILTSAMDVALLYLLLPRYGMGGYFFSFLITHLINFLLSLRLLLRTAGNQISFATPAFTASATAAGVLCASYVTGTVGRIISFVIVMGCLLVLLGVISKEDITWSVGLVQNK